MPNPEPRVRRLLVLGFGLGLQNWFQNYKKRQKLNKKQNILGAILDAFVTGARL